MSDTENAATALDPTEISALKRRRGSRLVWGGLLTAVVGAGVVYTLLTPSGGAGFGGSSSPCAGTGEIIQRVKPAIHGEVAALVPASTPLNVSQLSFKRADGSPTTMADWAGKTVLLNLWATWCAPCRAEMPALDRLQATLGSKDFEVLTINVDTASAGDKQHKFLADIGVKSLSYQSDPTLGVFKALEKVSRSRGLPTTMLIDGKGCEIGTMYGPASWDTPDAQRLITAALGR
jgi:thiol-disulfide isomerase/thioredoxin